MDKKGDDIQFAIEKHLAVLGQSKGGWTTELNLVSWNGRPAKLDIRPWDPSHERMGKGMTLSPEEASALREALNAYLSP